MVTTPKMYFGNAAKTAMGQRTRKDKKKAGERDKKSKKSKEEEREKKAKKREKKAKKKLKRKERALGEGAEGRVLPSDGVTETRGEETGEATEEFMSGKDKDATDSLVGREKVPRTKSMANQSRVFHERLDLMEGHGRGAAGGRPTS